MRLKDAVKIVERSIDAGSFEKTDEVEFKVAVRCLLETGKRLLGARRALKEISAIVSDVEHLNQQTLFGEDG